MDVTDAVGLLVRSVWYGVEKKCEGIFGNGGCREMKRIERFLRDGVNERW